MLKALENSMSVESLQLDVVSVRFFFLLLCFERGMHGMKKRREEESDSLVEFVS